jgi:hypothetical protein
MHAQSRYVLGICETLATLVVRKSVYDFTTHIEFGKYKKLLFPQYKKYSSLYCLHLSYKVEEVISGVRRLCHSVVRLYSCSLGSLWTRSTLVYL